MTTKYELTRQVQAAQKAGDEYMQVVYLLQLVENVPAHKAHMEAWVRGEEKGKKMIADWNANN